MTESTRKGWTSWLTSSVPESKIARSWPGARPLHHLKANRSEYFVDGELVAEIRWRQLEHWYSIKRPPAGYEPPEIDYARVLKAGAEWLAKKKAEREANGRPRQGTVSEEHYIGGNYEFSRSQL
jgi:hypothetical protein